MKKRPVVLIADDNPALLKVLVKKFTDEGFKTLQAKDGIELVDLALAHHPDVLVLDELMPKFTGLAALKRIRTNHGWGKRVPAMVLTNVARGTDIHAQFSRLNAEYMVKADSSLEEIVDTAKDLFQV